MLVHSSYKDHILSPSPYFNLSQVVVDSTYMYVHDGCLSLLDLAFVSDPLHVLECSMIPSLGNTDHHGVYSFNLTALFRQNKLGPRVKNGDMPT